VPVFTGDVALPEDILLAEAHVRNKSPVGPASLARKLDTLVAERIALKNRVSNILSACGRNIPPDALSNEEDLAEVLEVPRDELVRMRLRVIAGQIRALNKRIFELKSIVGE
jgi:hypothetical protein